MSYCFLASDPFCCSLLCDAGAGTRFPPCQLAPYQVLPTGAPEDNREPGKEEETCTFLVAFCEFRVCLRFLPASPSLALRPSRDSSFRQQQYTPADGFSNTWRTSLVVPPLETPAPAASSSASEVCVPARGSPPLIGSSCSASESLLCGSPHKF